MGRIIAVGPREHDFDYTNGLFSGSITLYGSNKQNNRSYTGTRGVRINHNVFSADQGRFVDDELLKKIEEDPDVRFMSYDPNQAFDCDTRIIERTLCLNEKEIMDEMNHKISFRTWAQNVCTVHHSELMQGKECTYVNLCRKFPGYSSFIIQANMATGGEGTYLLTELNSPETESMLLVNEQYLVSGYEYYNIPVNIHAIIYEQDILLFPISIQIMLPYGNKLLYAGADFVEAERIDSAAAEEFRKQMMNICIKLQKEGFRGITGVDGMIVNGKPYVLEMNNRFQGSTPLLNLALRDAGLKSMQELNYESFCVPTASCDVCNLHVPYSSFTYLADAKGNPPLGHHREWRAEETVVNVIDEGLDYHAKIAPYATLEKIVLKTNIVSILDVGRVVIHPLIPDISDEWYSEILENRNPLYLKIALINFGVVIEADGKKYLEDHGGMREGVYNAVDLCLKDMVVNSAVRVKFTALSPFHIRTSEYGLKLYFCERELTDITIKGEDKLGKTFLPSGVRVNDICFLATDRLRVQHSTNCHFKRCKVGCEFCEVEDHEFSFKMSDIFDAIDSYIASEYKFRHFLIGGRSDAPAREPEEILQIVEHIRQRGSWPIYVMCVPPVDKDILCKFHDAGVTEIAFNIEIWDREIAQKWMPGKGTIPLKRYLEMLEYAVMLWGNKGNVRSSFIVGLEPGESLIEGVKTICELGVAPILSVFRPIPGTVGQNFVPPANEELLKIYEEAQKICIKHGLRLGPTCEACQNNTLSMPNKMIENRSFF